MNSTIRDYSRYGAGPMPGLYRGYYFCAIYIDTFPYAIRPFPWGGRKQPPERLLNCLIFFFHFSFHLLRSHQAPPYGATPPKGRFDLPTIPLPQPQGRR